ncbi:hypothetical protein HYPSUDRAFT_143866 [Hypholoma sublateritium FD-334 SS-4]|uniref:DUF6532 domain-containing protein n=1 Tax=Hypholoma sublateritium (strain FD-334 SS-4) TaxID=945553 RepID=A0A0D2KXT9_HYPSF|nr:hypothetical protein HYPSUDRAFT_143866 [Hypholoma sublateritium FD-334 SS-4]
MYNVNNNWPEEAHYTPVAPGARNISIKDQPTPMRRMIRTSVNDVTGHFIFESAYPAANQAEFETFHRDVFLRCARRLEYPEITKRLKDDYELVKLCARVINARISLLRTQSKGITDKKVEGFYQLVSGSEAEKRVKELTNEDQNYIYPMTLGAVDTNRPYYHPCIISSIKEAFFTGSRGTLSQKYQARFRSTILEGPKKSELELPIAMVCIIATSAHASLDDWSQGYKRTKSDFRADAYESIYRGHELFLTTLQTERPDFFHGLMSGLYNAVVYVFWYSSLLIALG